MNDTTLLLTGAGVFSLMLIAIILTVLEFRQVSPQRKAEGADRTPADSEASAVGDPRRN
jgi:hypothetical protein